MNYLQKELYDLIKSDSAIFDFIQEASLDGLWYWDLENPENEWMSEKLWKVLGYDPAAMPHKTSSWQDIIYPEDLKVALNNFQEHCNKSDHAYDQVVRYRHGNGGTVWVRCRSLAVRDKSGKPIRMLGAHTDVTAEKIIEEKLKIQNKRHNDILEGANIGTWEWNVQTGEIIFNEWWAEIIGYTLAELRPVSIHTREEFTHPDDQKRSNAILKKHFDGELPFYECDVRMKHKSGRWVWTFDRGKIISHTPDGKPLWISGSHVDIDVLKRTQHQLKTSEEQFRGAFEHSPIGMALVSPEGKWLQVNRQLCRMLGYTEDELLNRSFQDILQSGSVEKEADCMQGLIAGEAEFYQTETFVLHKDGGLVWGRLGVSLVRDENGKPLHFVFQLQNISGQKSAEEKTQVLLKQLSDHKYALDQSSIVAVTNTHGVIKYANDNFSRISKYPIDELVGKDHRIINSGYHDKAFIRNLWDTISAGNVWKGEFRNKARDDSFYWVDTTIIPFLDSEGVPYQYMAIHSDITARKAAETEQKVAEALLRSSLESYKDLLIFSIDTSYRYLFFNSNFREATYKAYGINIKEGGSLFEGINNEDDIKRIRNNVERAMSGESHVTIEQYGEKVLSFFETRYNPIIDGQNSIIGVTVLSSNITDRKIAEDNILKLNKELEAFSYTIAHDLRAPLRIIDGYSRILLEEEEHIAHEEEHRFLDIIARNTNRMGQLIDDLLAFSRLGKLSIVREHVNMHDLIQSVIDEQRQLNSNQQIEFVINHTESLYCDRSLMRQVFSNLISNAVKYSSKKARSIVEIGSEKEGQEVNYYIQDNGVGFDMQYVDKLFGVFQRLHTEGEFEGTGVGLAIVQRIINMHGGKIRVESVPDMGTTFYLSLIT